MTRETFDTLMDALDTRRREFERQKHLYTERRFGRFGKQERESIARDCEVELAKITRAEVELQALNLTGAVS